MHILQYTAKDDQVETGGYVQIRKIPFLHRILLRSPQRRFMTKFHAVALVPCGGKHVQKQAVCTAHVKHLGPGL